MRSFARFCFWRERRPALRARARGLACAICSCLRPAGRCSPLISPVQGERARAAEYNDRAGKYKPDDPSYLRNKLYFAAQGS